MGCCEKKIHYELRKKSLDVVKNSVVLKSSVVKSSAGVVVVVRVVKNHSVRDVNHYSGFVSARFSRK